MERRTAPRSVPFPFLSRLEQDFTRRPGGARNLVSGRARMAARHDRQVMIS
jgi:hypothetical protein